MIRRPPRSTQSRSSAASDVYKRQLGLAAEEYASNKQTLEQQFSAQAQQDAWSSSLDYLPSGPVSVGQSWKKQASLSQGFPILLDTSYTLKDLQGCLLYTSPSPRD